MAALPDATRPLGPKDGAWALMVVSGDQVQWVPLDEEQALVIGRSPACDVFVEDGSLSRQHACIHVHGEAVAVEDLGSRNGTVLGGVPLPPNSAVSLPPDALVELGSTVLALRRMSAVPETAVGPHGRTRRRVGGLLRAGTSVLVLGEAGTGKRTLAVAGLQDPEVIEASGLGPADPAAWTSDRPRVVVRISEASRATQAALATWLQTPPGPVAVTSRVDPAQMARTRSVDPRLIRALPKTVLVVPTLSECGPEVVALARAVVLGLADTLCDASFSKAAREALLQRAWPGNVSQLQSVITAAASAAGGGVIEPAHLDADLASLSADARERLRILDALRECAGNQTSAAKQLGMSRRALVYRLDKYGIERPRRPTRDG